MRESRREMIGGSRENDRRTGENAIAVVGGHFEEYGRLSKRTQTGIGEAKWPADGERATDRDAVGAKAVARVDEAVRTGRSSEWTERRRAA